MYEYSYVHVHVHANVPTPQLVPASSDVSLGTLTQIMNAATRFSCSLGDPCVPAHLFSVNAGWESCASTYLITPQLARNRLKASKPCRVIRFETRILYLISVQHSDDSSFTTAHSTPVSANATCFRQPVSPSGSVTETCGEGLSTRIKMLLPARGCVGRIGGACGRAKIESRE